MNLGPLILGHTDTECKLPRGLNNREKRVSNGINVKLKIAKAKSNWTETR